MKRRKIAVAKAKKSKVVKKKNILKSTVKKTNKKIVKPKSIKATKKNTAKIVKKSKAIQKKKLVKTKVKSVLKLKSNSKTVNQKVVSKTKPSIVKAKNIIDYTKVITPLGDRLVVRPIASEKVTAGGLILPDSVTSTVGYVKGEVLAVGQGEYNKKGHIKQLDVQVGQKILFSEYASTQVKFNDENLYIVHEKDVLGIVD